MNSDQILMLLLGIPAIVLLWAFSAALVYFLYAFWKDNK